jgi:hypothetical protein
MAGGGFGSFSGLLDRKTNKNSVVSVFVSVYFGFLERHRVLEGGNIELRRSAQSLALLCVRTFLVVADPQSVRRPFRFFPLYFGFSRFFWKPPFGGCVGWAFGAVFRDETSNAQHPSGR